jgi:hypothetical protein
LLFRVVDGSLDLGLLAVGVGVGELVVEEILLLAQCEDGAQGLVDELVVPS